MFPCKRCGACCRCIGFGELGRELALPSGVCRYLDPQTNLCTCYASRPIFCNYDAYYEKYLANFMSKREFYQLMQEQCQLLRDLKGKE